MIQFSQSQPITNNVIQFTGNSSHEPDNLKVSLHCKQYQGTFLREQWLQMKQAKFPWL